MFIHESEDYIERLIPEIKRRFGNGFVIAHIEIEPPVLAANGEGDLCLVACDLWCENPSAVYDINILVEDKANYDVLDTPIVTSLEDAKNLALLISKQVKDFKIHP
ncbi:hypothetical protein GQG94_004736 [Salmonella enterica]|nr:hypothetical protein [Salmonella enterica subsp. enterica serovar Mbandaka]EEJ1220431.1 hypothetical protein [Salmonella enterica]ELK3355864.1 hypothetical protein [Salmonella enterica]